MRRREAAFRAVLGFLGRSCLGQPRREGSGGRGGADLSRPLLAPAAVPAVWLAQPAIAESWCRLQLHQRGKEGRALKTLAGYGPVAGLSQPKRLGCTGPPGEMLAPRPPGPYQWPGVAHQRDPSTDPRWVPHSGWWALGCQGVALAGRASETGKEAMYMMLSAVPPCRLPRQRKTTPTPATCGRP